MIAPSATVRMDDAAHTTAVTHSRPRAQPGPGRRRNHSTGTTTPRLAVTSTAGLLKVGVRHSRMYGLTARTAAKLSYSRQPRGVTAVTAAPAATMAPSCSARRRGRRWSRARPSTVAAPTVTPATQVPWEQAHSHITGTIHHRGRRSEAVRSQASTTTASSTNPTSCGRGLRLSAVPRTAALATRVAARGPARLRHRTNNITHTASRPAVASHATAGRPPTWSAHAIPSSGSHWLRIHGRVVKAASGSSPANSRVRHSCSPARMCQSVSGSPIPAPA